MRNEIRGIAVDNGGSESRVQDGMNPTMENIIKFANDFVVIQEKDFRVKDVAEPAMLCRIKEAPNPEFKCIIAQGLTGRAFDNQAITISSQEEKTSNINYYKQFIFAVAQDALKSWIKAGGYTMCSSRSGEAMQCNTVPELYKYAIVVCIPIKEFNGKKDCADILKNTLAGRYSVEFPLMDKSPVVNFEISADLIGVVPEGGVAIRGIKNELDDEEISLVIDMGCVTTDIGLFKGIHLLGKVVSSQFAGSTLLANVRVALADEGYILSESQVEKVLETKTVKNGKNTVDVSDIVNAQLSSFVSNYLKQEITQVLNMNAVNAKQIQNLIPLGAPMNNPTENLLISEIVSNCGLGKAEVKILAEDLRYVNIQQASKFVRRLVNKAKA